MTAADTTSWAFLLTCATIAAAELLLSARVWWGLRRLPKDDPCRERPSALPGYRQEPPR